MKRSEHDVVRCLERSEAGQALVRMPQRCDVLLPLKQHGAEAVMLVGDLTLIYRRRPLF